MMNNTQYIIVGSGPSAITLSIILAKNNKSVKILEIDNDIGGCWKTMWIDDKYYCEHSPKIMFEYEYFKQLLILLNIDPKDEFNNVYGSRYQTFIYFCNFFMHNLNFHEILKVFKGYLQYLTIGFDNNLTLHDWLVHNKFTKNGYNAIRITSIAAANVPDKLLASVFFKSFNTDLSKIKQLKFPVKWLSRFKAFARENNITISCNEQIVKINTSQDRVTSVVSQNTLNKTYSYHFASDDFFVCVPLKNLFNIVNNSNVIVRNNWMDFSDFKQFCFDSSYTSIGFQFHFDVIPPVNFKYWCTSCLSDWTIILLDIGKYRHTISKDHNIKVVWSLCIVDIDAYSNNLRKTVRDCSQHEIISETLFQLSQVFDVSLNPFKITFYKNVQNYSYSNLHGTLNHKGKIKNLYSVGPHNLNEIANMEVAIKSSVRLAQDLDFDTSFIQPNSTYHIWFTFLFIVIVFISLKEYLY